MWRPTCLYCGKLRNYLILQKRNALAKRIPDIEAYCRTRWDYGKSHSYRLIECGAFIHELETTQSRIGDWARTESQIRLLVAFPQEDRLAWWQDVLTGNPAGKTVKAATLARITPKVGRSRSGKAHKSLLRLRTILKSHPDNEKIAELLSQIEDLLDQD